MSPTTSDLVKALRPFLLGSLTSYEGDVGGVDVGALQKARFVTMTSEDELINERVLTAGDGLDLTDGGAGAAATLAVDLKAISGLEVDSAGLALSDAAAGDGLTIADKVLAVGAGNGLQVSADAVAIKLKSPSGLEVDADGLVLADGVAGAGLTIANKVLAVGQGDGLTVSADAVALMTPGTLSAITTNDPSGNHTHAVSVGTPISVTLGSNSEGSASSLARSDHHHHLSESIVPTWTGTHTFQATMTTRDILPELTDAYDLGSSLKWWRGQYVSNINAAVFVENTAQLLGGWLVIGHDQGALAADVAPTDTTVDFGKGMTPNDFILIRSHDADGIIRVEYMQIGTLVTGTRYNVTRDLGNTYVTDPAWAAGTPYLVLGYTGDGRIELSSFGTPRISLIKQLQNYYLQTEVARLGDLNGNWGYGVETYGVALGQYAAGATNLTADPVNGIRLRSYTQDRIALSPDGVLTIRDSAGAAVITLDADQGAEITKKLTMPGTSSAIAIGAIPPTGAGAGTGIWIDRTGMYGLASDVLQAKFSAESGTIEAGGGHIKLDADGLIVTSSGVPPDVTTWTRFLHTDVVGYPDFYGCVYTMRDDW